MQADKMFSKVTVTTGRSLLSLSAIVIASRLLGFKLTGLPFIHQSKLDEPELISIAWWLIIFILLAHVINWLNDYNGYVFDRFEALADRYDLAAPSVRLDHPDEARFQKSVHRAIDQHRQALSNESCEDHLAIERYEALEADVAELSGRLARTRPFSRIVEFIAFYIQHLVLPIGVSLLALGMIARAS